ncbi:phage major capsid protein [Clostridium sp. CCUG 7971]|uniref:phage major capsid protein n=1 Tax=Clostridium sp. CCUG 7971 TaxID=2811414 RepID=UPI001ABAD652|nr:phage major capsid protein [Clostridium sp. CCUG 7971]MBO3443408.1 phage major capsid protein [Clostridium sp. CCUG 7971]
MNKKMRELLSKIEQKGLMAKGFMEDGENKEIEKASKLLNEIEELQKEYDLEEKLFNLNKKSNEPTIKQIKEKSDNINGFKVIGKMLNKNNLTEEEKSLIVGGESGEDYLVPQDVRTQIREYRRNYISLKLLVNVVPVTTLSGSTNFEKDDNHNSKLTKLTQDGEEINTATAPKFIQKPWKIEEYGDLIPISRVLLGNEQAQLMSYINKWFIKKAINTENYEIVETLKVGKTVKAIKGWEALKKSINKDLDPALLIGGVILTNQTGFTALDEEKDENGRPILKENPTEATPKMFQGLPIHVVSDAMLPNVSGKAPIFYGNLKEGQDFMDRETLTFDISEHYLFNKNMNCLRVIEMFDTVQTDSNAYIYATFEATPAKEPVGA